MKHTITTGELIAFLRRYPSDLPVFATWEGVLAPIQIANIEIKVMDLDKSAMVIDVEDY